MATKRTRRHFDLEAAARRLFLAAQAKNDFSGAAACLRLVRDLRPSEDAPKPKDEWVPLATDEEFQELSGLLDAIDALESRVKQRLGLAPTTAPVAAPINAVAPSIVEPAPLPFDLYPNEIIRDGNVIEIDPETGEETLIGSIEAVVAEGREGDDDESA